MKVPTAPQRCSRTITTNTLPHRVYDCEYPATHATQEGDYLPAGTKLCRLHSLRHNFIALRDGTPLCKLITKVNNT